jgi:para-nitrobenzyl esterase
MKNIYLAFSVLALCACESVSNAQNCDNDRYFNSIFPTLIEVKDVEYGKNLKQDSVTEEILKMDIYRPAGDVDTNRPLLIFAHGGSFISGSKADGTDVCREFAKKGYVAASISYRLLAVNANVLANPGLEFKRELVRAVHDMRAAIRFFRKSVVEENNPYGINTDKIIVSGGSAGAILAVHATYMDDMSKAPVDMHDYITTQGGIEGFSGNPGYSSVPQLAISLCGAIGDTLMMEAGDQPFAGVHTFDDDVVPNLAASPTVGGFNVPVTLYGDSLIHVRAKNQGVKSAYLGYPTGGHCGFPIQETFDFVRNFMYDYLCVNGPVSSVGRIENLQFSVYPNPADQHLTISVASNNSSSKVSIESIVGQQVWAGQMAANQNLLTINTHDFTAGVYFVRLTNEAGNVALKRVVVK